MAMSVRELARLDRELAAVLSAEPRDPAVCAQVLERATFACRTEPLATQKWVEAELLYELVDCYEDLGRVDEAITVMRRAIDVGWGRKDEVDGRCRIAELLMRDGRVQQATVIWQQVRADSPDDAYLHWNAGVEYTDIGDHETAFSWFTPGLKLAMATNDLEDLVELIADLREECLTELGRRPDQLQHDAAAFLAMEPRLLDEFDHGPTAEWSTPMSNDLWPPVWSSAGADAPSAPARPAPQSVQANVACAWLPATDYVEALRRWPQLAEHGPAKDAADHTAYNLAMQHNLAGYADAGMTRIHVVPLRVQPFLQWCERTGNDPGTSGARANYSAELLRLQDPAVVPWPPGRNQRCWCGSGRKYKQCCGSAAR